MQGTASLAVHKDTSCEPAAATSDSLMDAASTAIHRDTADHINSQGAMIGIAGISLEAASTAVAKDAALPGSSRDTVIGIAGDALHPSQHAAAAANPFMACVREEQQQPPRQGFMRGRKNRLLLVLLATTIVVVGVALGVGLQFGLSKGRHFPASGLMGTAEAPLRLRPSAS